MVQIWALRKQNLPEGVIGPNEKILAISFFRPILDVSNPCSQVLNSCWINFFQFVVMRFLKIKVKLHSGCHDATPDREGDPPRDVWQRLSTHTLFSDKKVLFLYLVWYLASNIHTRQISFGLRILYAMLQKNLKRLVSVPKLRSYKNHPKRKTVEKHVFHTCPSL